MGSRTWSNPENALASDDARATTTDLGATSPNATYGLALTDFDFSTIPDAATVNGIEIAVEARKSAANSTLIVRGGPFKNGSTVPTATEDSSGLSTSDSVKTLGGASSLFGSSWTGADVKNSGFGVRIQIVMTAETGVCGGEIDAVTVTVHYSVAVSLAGAQPSATGRVYVSAPPKQKGAQAAPSGALAAFRLKSLAGAQPSASGALTQKRLVAPAGAQPAGAGALTVRRVLSHVALAGAQPSASGVEVAFRAAPVVEGAQAAPSGALTAMRLKTVVGAQPMPWGLLNLVRSTLFPEVLSITPSSFDSNATDHNVAMPATVDPNDLLVCLFANDGSATVTNPGSGWNELHTTANGSAVRFGSYYKIADGTEDGATVNFVTSAGERAAAQVYRIKAGTWQGIPVIGTAATGTSVNPNPPANTPARGTYNYLWIAAYGADDDDDASAYPTNFSTNNTYTQSGSGTEAASLGSATRKLSTDTQNPGNFTIAASEEWVAQTIAIAGGIPVVMAGRQAEPSGSVVGEVNALEEAAVDGEQPAASGALTAQRVFSQIALAGNQAAPSGALVTEWVNKGIVGAQPAGSGTVAIRWLFRQIGVAGEQASATGAVASLRSSFVSVAGNQAEPSGALAFDITLRHIAVSGEQAAAAGVLAAHFVFSQVSLAGSQPAGSGLLTLAIFKLLVGNQAAGSGTLSVVTGERDVGFGPMGGTGKASVNLGVGRGSLPRLGGGVGRVTKLGPGRGRYGL